MSNLENLREFTTLIEIMKKLRGPDGCPWDREQTVKSLKPYLIEEAYEVLEVMDIGGEKLREELGDLLLQVIFQSEIKSSEGEFNIYDVIETLNSKLIRRHPHVFGEVTVADSGEVITNWEKIKKNEKGYEDRKSVLDGIPVGLPSILKAFKMQKKAAKAGFDWDNQSGAIEKMEEEIQEMRDAIKNNDFDNLKEEIGDVMFSIINVARLSGIDPDEALRDTIEKFSRRFRYIEKNIQIEDASLEEMEKLWQEAKKVRIDKFLKLSRVIKRRTVAKNVGENEKIKINGITKKPSSEIKEGDTVELEYYGKTIIFKVIKVPERNIESTDYIEIIEQK